MPSKSLLIKLCIVLILLLCIGSLTACINSNNEPTPQPGLHTWLLVKAPDHPLPVNKPVNVRSRTEDSESKISHVELYAVQLPSGQTSLLIRSDRAPFDQTSFTASQKFIPKQTGHYVVQVVGYNHEGEMVESNVIGFDVE